MGLPFFTQSAILRPRPASLLDTPFGTKAIMPALCGESTNVLDTTMHIVAQLPAEIAIRPSSAAPTTFCVQLRHHPQHILKWGETQ